jgi:hypothetical protein
VESPSVIIPLFAITLTAEFGFQGLPGFGIRQYDRPYCPAEDGAVCSEVELLSSRSMTCGSILREGSRKCTSHAALTGGKRRWPKNRGFHRR